MPKIQLLPEELRSKIAAGEVVERPASVVKELIENAFDAGAKTIKVGLKDGGLSLVRVYDDGEGMDEEDLKLCYRHHATSKIKSLKDIFRIVTFGFRGEALASIARVSKLLIKSRFVESPQAYQVLVEYGKLKDFKPCVLAKGTLVEVKDLFSNLPARKAFLRSPRAETNKIAEVVKGLALCFPERNYELKTLSQSTERVLFSWKGGTLKELIAFISEVDQKEFKEVHIKKPPYEIHLVLSATSSTFSHTRYLYTLVNHRLVRDERLNKILLSAIKPFYGHLGYPAGVLHIKTPYHLVDVNVHPAKWEVRFKDEKEVFTLIKEALERAFSKTGIYFEKRDSGLSASAVKEDIPVEYSYKSREEPLRKPEKREEPLSFDFKREDFTYIGSFVNTYLLVERQRNLYLVDQHALCERILFEELKENYETKASKQELLLPILLRLSSRALESLPEKIKVLDKLGFELELIGEKEVLLKSVPSLFKEDIKEVLEEVLEEEFFDERALETRILAGYACKLARKKGELLSKDEARYLLRKMFEKGLSTCPHGRPIYVVMSEAELEKRLKRRL